MNHASHATRVAPYRLSPTHAGGVPGLDPGLTLLDGGPEAVHRVVAAELADGRTEALWVDPGMAVSVHALYDLAPSRRTLAGLRIARAFTAYQHHALVRELVQQAGPRTELVVLPAFNGLAGGTWINVEGQEFLAPFLPEGLSSGEAFLLDGTRLGDYRTV